MMDKEKMMGFMMDMCCKGMSDEDKQKMKDMCKDMAGRFSECCGNMDVSSFMKRCCSEPAGDKTKS